MNYSNTFRLALVAIASIGGVSMAAVPVTVASDTAPQTIVSLTGLDLSTTAGTAVAQQRIRIAARQLCEVRSTQELNRRMAQAACYRTAVDHAYARLADVKLRNAPAYAALDLRAGHGFAK
jgi:UrcA family protein